MDFFNNKEYVNVKPVFPEYSKKKGGIEGVFSFIVAILFWILLIIVSVVALYTNWFTKSLTYLLRLVSSQHYHIPFWFSLIFVFFLFPVTLVVVLLSTFIKIIRS